MKRKFKTKPNGKISQEKNSNYRKRDRIEIAGNSENFFQRKMNQKASKHSRLCEQRERERETTLLDSYLSRERERERERALQRDREGI